MLASRYSTKEVYYEELEDLEVQEWSGPNQI